MKLVQYKTTSEENQVNEPGGTFKNLFKLKIKKEKSRYQVPMRCEF